MNKKEFDDSFDMMCKALGVKVNKYQGLLFWDEFKHRNAKDFHSACLYCGRGTAGKMPFQTAFGDSITAASEMRQEQERLKRESDLGQVHRINFTPQERLEANRGAFEALRQARECKATGRNCWSPIKVREAILDPSKDEEIRAKYGDEGPSPAMVFGGSFELA